MTISSIFAEYFVRSRHVNIQIPQCSSPFLYSVHVYVYVCIVVYTHLIHEMLSNNFAHLFVPVGVTHLRALPLLEVRL